MQRDPDPIRREVFAYYLGFLRQRLEMFWARADVRATGLAPALAAAPPVASAMQPLLESINAVLTPHRFTNVYRAADRVSQYLIRKVIYMPEQAHGSDMDLALCILLFRIFNRIDVWQDIVAEIGMPRAESFARQRAGIARVLARRVQHRQPVWNGAYIMAPALRVNLPKHESWLLAIEEHVLRDRLLQQVLQASSLETMFHTLKRVPGMGNFVAMQVATDINYSELTAFSEDDFISPGPGAVRGLTKCFNKRGLAALSHTDALKYTREHLDDYTQVLGIDYRGLPGRQPSLMDIQNCYCETDKLLRVCKPDLDSTRKRIKQRYGVAASPPIDYFFPPKWGVGA